MWNLKNEKDRMKVAYINVLPDLIDLGRRFLHPGLIQLKTWPLPKVATPLSSHNGIGKGKMKVADILISALPDLSGLSNRLFQHFFPL